MSAAFARTRLITIGSLCCILSTALPAAHADQYQPFGEVRGYPSGAIISAGLGRGFGDHYYASAHAAYNFVDRGDNGEFENEDGGGFGFGVTLDKFFQPAQTGWFVGGRAELFFLGIDYRDPASPELTGAARCVVVAVVTGRITVRRPVAGACA